MQEKTFMERCRHLSWGASGILLHLHSINARVFSGAYLQEVGGCESIDVVYRWLAELEAERFVQRLTISLGEGAVARSSEVFEFLEHNPVMTNPNRWILADRALTPEQREEEQRLLRELWESDPFRAS
jgi:hypothetical protein